MDASYSAIVVATIAAIPLIMTALIGLYNAKKTNEIAQKQEVIHVLVNNNFKKALADLAAAQEKIEYLQGIIADLHSKSIIKHE